MLLLIGGLLATAAVLIIGAPRILTVGAWRMRFPRLALAIWHSAFLVGVAALLGSLVVAVATSMMLPSGGRDAWVEPTVLVLFGWGGLTIVGAVIALVAAQAEPLANADRRTQMQFSLLAAASRCQQVHGIDVVIVDSALPIAVSVPGPDARVVVASCLERELSKSELRAVIEHERAHLIQHHGAILRLAQLNRACLPGLLASRELDRTTNLLIELIADDTAARAVGAVNTANALVKVGNLRSDESMLLRARRLASRPPAGSMSTARRVRRTIAGLSA